MGDDAKISFYRSMLVYFLKITLFFERISTKQAILI